MASTPEGMRELIRKHARHSPLIHTVFSIAEQQKYYTGELMSELDIMTFLAFHAIIRMEAVEERLLHRTRINPLDF
jgi:hypothetical protein